MATLSEVARMAGVTTATVSNVLRNPGKVKPSTVQKVQEAIAATGYRPNLMARALAEGKSSVVAIILPSITNPFYPEFVRVAERVARQRDFLLMVCNTDEQAEIGRAYLKRIAGTLADGVLVLHTGMGVQEMVEMVGRRTPIVIASEENAEEVEGVPQAVVDFRMAGALGAEHLVSLGHRRIGVIVGRGCGGSQHLRMEGFQKAISDAGLTLEPQHVRDIEDSVAGGHAATLSLLENDPSLTALFCTNDLLAFGASQALADMGIRIPDDVSVMGVTDIQLAEEMRPALTTVALRIDEIARISIELLLDLINDPDHHPTVVRVPEPRLIVRASTGPVRRENTFAGRQSS